MGEGSKQAGAGFSRTPHRVLGSPRTSQGRSERQTSMGQRALPGQVTDVYTAPRKVPSR